jgi:hypothetical protein
MLAIRLCHTPEVKEIVLDERSDALGFGETYGGI